MMTPDVSRFVRDVLLRGRSRVNQSSGVEQPWTDGRCGGKPKTRS